MKISISTSKTRYRIFEPIRAFVRIENTNEGPVEICRELLELDDFLNHTRVYWLRHGWANPPLVSAAPGEGLTIEHELALNYFSLAPAGDESEVVCCYQLVVVVAVQGVAHRVESPLFSLCIDFAQTRPMLTLAGVRSNYVIDGSRVMYVTPGAYRPELGARVVKTRLSEARVASDVYLVDESHVFRAGALQKGVSAKGFRIFNAIFAGNEEVILTSYGDAKVEDPPTFEVLDAADQSIFPGGTYRAGFARDKANVYFFDESTSTRHAVRVKACKNPKTFVVLANGYARDDANVYREAQRIKGADANTWTRLNRNFSRDAKTAFYLTEPLPDADLASFAVVVDPRKPADTPDSLWAKDARGYFERHTRKSEAEYRAAGKKR